MKTENRCSFEIDYSEIPGEKILPFTVSLNTEESVLYPSEGQLQKFCYLITGVGQDLPQYADLSHFLLNICSTITREDISEITVSINDDPQTIIWGENVEFKTKENPDPPTECIGLKFDFPLNKEIGYMKICFSLKNIYPVGPVDVCLFGGGTTAAGLTICGPVCSETNECESLFNHKETVCVPVTVTPFARPGSARTICCGKPEISTETSCYGERTSCSFTVSQELCIELPITFGAQVETGSISVQCDGVSNGSCSCSDEEIELPSKAPLAQRERRFFNR